jgi:serine/threonine protein kinase, bacterial
VEGTPFGHYRLIELLGRGGMGEVWRAFDIVTDRIVALKVLPEHFSQDQVFQERFRREAHAAARLNEPHVVPIHTYGEIDGRLFVDMRLIEGHDLQTVLAAGPLSPDRAVRIIEQVAKALHAAHQIGLVHRDVKPSNILLAEDDFAYLIDFGIARAAGETGLTGTSGVIGSWRYMAPEQFSARQADARADVYALACVLYECLTGQPPYPGDSLEQQYAGHVATPPPRPSSTDPNLPRGFDSVTDKGLAKDPRQRYATTVELAHAARDATTEPIPKPAPRVPAAPPTSPVSAAAAPTIAGRDQTPSPRDVSTSATIWQRPPAEVPTRRREERPLTPPSRPWWRRRAAVLAAAVVLTVIAVAVTVTVNHVSGGRNRNNLATASPAPPAVASPAPPAAGDPTGYAFDAEHVVYRGTDNGIHELWSEGTTWHHYPLSASVGAPAAAGDPTGYWFDAEKTQHVVYRGLDDGHIHELWWGSGSNGWHHNDLSASVGAPAAGDPKGYVFDAQRTQHVVYRGADNGIHELWSAGPNWSHTDLSA